MTPAEAEEQVHPATAAEWADWLERNHERPHGVWWVHWRKAAGREGVTYEAAVTEALRFGWVDSRARGLDEERSMLWFAPRRAGSSWAGTNKARIEQLEREGRMAPAGRRAVETAKADGSWTRLDAVERLEVPDDLAEAFRRHPGARERWDGFPPSARRAILAWIVDAKREATRARRVEETARLGARGERANEWRPKE